jgi:hypothetical protein
MPHCVAYCKKKLKPFIRTLITIIGVRLTATKSLKICKVPILNTLTALK